MTIFFSKRGIVALWTTACLLVLLACQLTQGAKQPVAGQATDAPSAGATEGAVQVEMEFGPGAFSLPDPTVGLAELASYKATLILSFDGTQDGQPSQWSHTYVMLASQAPAAHQITIEAAGGVPASVFMAEMNGVSYEISGENNCTASTEEASSSLQARWEPAGFLSGIIGAEAASGETVNGVATDHYTFDERALGETGFTQSTGQVWVASEKGYVVRYLLTTTAGANYFGEGIEGAQTWEYNLTNINQPVTIDLPAGCPGGLVDAPLMPDAQEVRRLPGVTIYSTASNIQEVQVFYQEQMPALGWEATGEPTVTDTMGLTIYVQGDQQLTVIVTTSENNVEVSLLMGAAPSPEATP